MKLSRALRFAALLPTHRFTGIDLILTRRCNLACSYCGVINSPVEQELTPAQWLKIIAWFRRNRHVHFIFTGGEALLYNGLPELVTNTRRHSLTCLMSNGKELTEEALRELPGLDFLTLSLDPEGTATDSGKHGFERLDMLREYSRSVGLSVSVMATVTRSNARKVPALARRMKAYGFPLLLSLYHSGNRKFDFRTDHADLDFHTPESLADLGTMAEELIELKRQGYPVGENEWYLRSLVPFKQGAVVTPCRAGRDWFEVDADGRIKACHDGPPSHLNALDEPTYETLPAELAGTLPPQCRCMYDFYFNAQHLRTRPLSYLWSVFWSRNIVSRWKA
jgi:MoaA/NifB/PqqE/SkfB family radical SAM enzyme